jgi:glycerol-3-phosphate dehydrogenase
MSRTKLSLWTKAFHQDPCEVLVIGGGATGLGVAVQAALEGRRVVLVEARDFACGTSSRSTKLLHGGVRYLAQGRIKLVREALRERAVVLGLAPHLAQPLPFVVAEKNRLSWAITAVGLKLYQWLAGSLSLGKTASLSRADMQRLLPGLPGVVAGVRYWDGQFDDARLALSLARTAQAAGAQLRNHISVVGLVPNEQGWSVELEDALTGERATVQTRCVVNAAGVWIDQLRHWALANSPQPSSSPLVRPSQGVHLVVSRDTLPLDQAVLVPRTTDGRVLFAVPWLGSIIIGTTDTPRDDAPLEPRPMAEELAFLFTETARGLGVELKASDVMSVWVGLRPLVNLEPAHAQSTAQVSREHFITREVPGFLTVTGGKWTTYRAMAQEALETLIHAGDLSRPIAQANTHQHRLWGAPSSDTPQVSIQEAPGPHLYGTDRVHVELMPGRDKPLGLGLTEAMVRFSARHEWAVTVEDMLARRWRTLFLDARAANAAAPAVAAILFEETGIDPELNDFLSLCQQYQLKTAPTPPPTHGAIQ